MAKFAMQDVGFHETQSVVWDPWAGFELFREDVEFTYTFENFFHPHVGRLIEELNQRSLAGLLDPTLHASLAQDFFTDFYHLAGDDLALIAQPFPRKEIDVSESGPYAVYNWELLFHLPLAVAVHLGKNQRFAEAQRWFHYVFDPTSNDTTVPPPQRFWKFLRFRRDGAPPSLAELLLLLSKPDAESTPAELERKRHVLEGYTAILDDPFQPHRVARTRVVAYQYSVVMKYLDNLIAWGDSLFLQDTVESINEATQRYVLAANLLGPRPQRIPPRGTVPPSTFAQLKARGLDAMGNTLVELEGQFPFNQALPYTRRPAGPQPATPLFGIGRTLYFCIPRNDQLLAYWDTVADRLYKVRHCMNLAGVVRQLALFDPPLDPGLLVKAAAAGLDLGSLVAGLNQPIGPVRSLLLVQKALELSAEVRGLGAALLAALEKGDGERLSLLRQGHEIKIQQLTQDVRFLQWQQAREATEALLRTRASALERYRYYRRLLGLQPDAGAPDVLPLDRRELTEEGFDEAHAALVGQYDQALAFQAFPTLRLAAESPQTQSGAAGSGPLHLTNAENQDLNVHSPAMAQYQVGAWAAKQVAPVLGLIPQFPIDLHFWGIGGTIEFGGEQLAKAAIFASDLQEMLAGQEGHKAASAAKSAGFARRADDWLLQHNLAARELAQLGRQLLTSLLAEQVAHHEYQTVRTQIEQSRELDRFLHEKYTNEELYNWMQGEIARLYYEYYRFAFDTARRAERTVKRELMRPEVDATDYVKFNYWDGGRKGLLAGEALYLDVKRLELAFHEHNQRELEIAQHVSLRQLDPLALLTLKVTGRCEVTVPEWLFDRDCPGHYLRRLKSVAVSIPSVVGPYTGVHCTVSLLRSSLRTSPLQKDGNYRRQGPEDDRFTDTFGAVESIVTSGGVNDGGLFETNLRDERLLPFEGRGAISTWSLELAADLRSFDYLAISDVILHLRYTARQGGDRHQVQQDLRQQLADAGQVGLALLFSLRHDFPTEWSAFAAGGPSFAARLRKDHFPYLVQDETLVIDSLDLYARHNRQLAKRTEAAPATLATLADALNGPDRAADLPALAPDANVLKRDSQAFLIVRYRLLG
jgi:hypothetical protein